MNSTLPSGSMPAPRIAAALDHQGIRYQEDPHVAGDGKDDGAAYLAAFDPHTNQRLWSLRIESGASGAPLFAFDFYAHLTHIEAAPEPDILLVTTDSGKRYRVDLRSQRILDGTRISANPAPASLVQPSAEGFPDAFPALPDSAPAILHDRVHHHGILYRQGTSADGLATMQESWLVAEDEQSGKVLWQVKVGTKPDNAGASWQAALLTFSDLSIGPGANELTIVDYLGRHFLVNLITHTATLQTPTAKDGQVPHDPFEPPLDPLMPGFPR